MNYIVSIHYNNIELLETQYKSIKKYMQGEYTYIVFNDGVEYSNAITMKCNKLGIKCINIDQDIHIDRNLVFPKELLPMRQVMNNPPHDSTDDLYWKNMKFDRYNSILNNNTGSRHCDSIQYIINYFLNNINDTRYLFNIDADMFLINNINIDDYMDNCHIASFFQGRRINEIIYWEYIWPNIFIINFKECPNLNEISMDGTFLYDNNKMICVTDTGGESGYYLQKYKDILKIKSINGKIIIDNIKMDIYNLEIENQKIITYLLKMNNINNGTGPNKEIFLNDSIIHLRGVGSNWIKKSKEYNKMQIKIFNEIFNF